MSITAERIILYASCVVVNFYHKESKITKTNNLLEFRHWTDIMRIKEDLQNMNK